MKRIGIIGGTFDPIHYGHLILAEQARVEASLDQVIFIPAMVQPFKLNTKISEGDDRYEMVRKAITGNPFFSVSRMELDREGISYTIRTLNECKSKFGDDTELYFIMGTDAFLNLEKWYAAEDLLNEFAFIIGTRPGYKERELKMMIGNLSAQYDTNIIEINNSEVEISSTDIKNRIRAGKSIKYLVPEQVEEYIYRNELYQDLT